jgi:hypothetical protein
MSVGLLCPACHTMHADTGYDPVSVGCYRCGHHPLERVTTPGPSTATWLFLVAAFVLGAIAGVPGVVIAAAAAWYPTASPWRRPTGRGP